MMKTQVEADRAFQFRFLALFKALGGGPPLAGGIARKCQSPLAIGTELASKPNASASATTASTA